jgi:hypothetical protein
MIIPKQQELRIADLKAAEYNPASRAEGASLRELADSMSRIGLIYAVVVDDSKKLIDGHRRCAAAKLLGWETIRAQIMPADQREAIYAGVNATAKKMLGRDALGVWLSNPNAVTPAQAKRFETMEASIGKSLSRRIFKEGLSARVWETAKKVCRYCQIDEITGVTEWLLDHAVIGQVMKALESREDPRVFVAAIKKNRPIKFKLSVD